MSLRDFLFRRRRERDLQDEIASHLDMATRDYVERGLSPDEARAAARRELGNEALVRQATREMWSGVWLEQWLQDLRFGARILRQSPGLSATAILLVALVVGANTTIYSMVNSLLVSPAAGVTAPGLLAISHAQPGATIADPYVSFPNYRDYARLTTTLDGLTAASDERLTLATDTATYAVFGALVTTNYFDTLGVAIAHGRGLHAADDDAAHGLAVVIGDRVWHEQFGGDPGVVGRALRINGVAGTVVGVAEPSFAGALLTPGARVWVPINAYYRAAGNARILDDRAAPLVIMIGARRPGVSRARVQAEFDALAAQLHASYPDGFTAQTGRGVVPLAAARATVAPYSAVGQLPVAQMAPIFLALFSIVTLLTVLIVSANVANLLLGRAVARQRDTAVRRALGASRGRIVRMLVAEGLTISLAAWAAACVMAWWTSRALLQWIEPQAGLFASMRPDWTLAAYAMILAGAGTLMFTLAPAMRAWRLPVLPLLRSGEQGVIAGRSRLSNALVVLQLAFSVLLLTSAGLAYRSLSMFDSGHVGFDPADVVLTTVRVGQQTFGDDVAEADRAATLVTLERVRERLIDEPLVATASYARRVPGAYFLGATRVRRADGTQGTPAFVRTVGPGYLPTLGLTPVAGRDLDPRDRRGATPVAVVNEHLAAELFPGEPAVGQRLIVGEWRTPYEIVGVAPNALFDGPVRDPRPRYVFLSQAQAGENLTDMTFFVRHRGSLDAATPAIHQAIADAAPAVPIVATATLSSRLDEVSGLERQVTTLLVAFALASLVVAAVGQYAIAMFNARRRTRDFGVRMALGASTAQIQRAVVRDAFRLTTFGCGIGFALSIAAAVAFRSVLFGVTPVDPPAYAAVLAVLAVTSLAASLIPAWRAGRVNVVEALRQE